MRLVLFTLLVVVATILPKAFGAPAQDVDPNLKSFFIDAYDDEQTFSYRTNDGQTRDETVSWVNGKLVISGYYRYLAPDGQYYLVQYEADENGYRPMGAHLPGADPNPDLYVISTPFAGSLSKTALLSLVG